MPDVFLSYAHEDRNEAFRIAALLEQRGHSVWWDPNLIPSRNYVREIDGVLREARAVVVLWTRNSVASDFVLEEASMAREQGKLVGALLQDVELPVSFRLIQAADLRGWDGDAGHPGIQQLETGIRACQGDLLPPTSLVPSPGRWIVWFGLLWPTLLAAVIVLVLWQCPWPTSVEAEVATKRFRFHTSSTMPQPLFQGMGVRSLAVRGFAELRLPQRAQTRVTGHDAALATDGQLVLSPAGEDPARISLRPADSHELLSVDGVSARAAEVTVDVPEPGSFGVTVRGAKVSAGASLPAEVDLIATGCAASAAAWPVEAPSVTLHSHLSRTDRLLDFSSGAGALRMVFGLAPARDQPTLRADLQVDSVEFQDQAATGKLESTIASGTLRLPDRGRHHILNGNDFLAFEDLRSFLVRRVDLSKNGTLQVVLYGVVGTASYGPKENVRREQFTIFSALAARPAVAGALTVVLWLLPTLLAWRRFRRTAGL